VEAIERFVERAQRERCILARELDANDFVLLDDDGALQTYRHEVTGRQVTVDDRGRPHRFVGGRHREQKLGHAVWELDPVAMRASRPPVRHLRLVHSA
jgi:hypothetical protein